MTRPARRARCSTAAWQRLRRKVLQRDGYRCQKCDRAGRLEVHHLDHDWTNDDPANLAAWCRSCHIEHHRERRRKRKPKGAAEWDRYLAGLR